MIRVLQIISDTNIGGGGRSLLNYLSCCDRSRFSSRGRDSESGCASRDGCVSENDCASGSGRVSKSACPCGAGPVPAAPAQEIRKAASRPQQTAARNPFAFIYFPSLCRRIS